MNHTARINVRHSLFLQVAQSHQRLFHAVGKSIRYSTTHSDSSASADRDFYTHAYTVILFGALACEAVIYDFGARHLGDTLTKDHLDRLDAISKWIVIPRLVTGKELPKSGELFMVLKRTIAARNDLAHSKTQPFPQDASGSLSPERFLEMINTHEANLALVVDDAAKVTPMLCQWLYEQSGDSFLLLNIEH